MKPDGPSDWERFKTILQWAGGVVGVGFTAIFTWNLTQNARLDTIREAQIKAIREFSDRLGSIDKELHLDRQRLDRLERDVFHTQANDPGATHAHDTAVGLQVPWPQNLGAAGRAGR